MKDSIYGWIIFGLAIFYFIFFIIKNYKDIGKLEEKRKKELIKDKVEIDYQKAWIKLKEELNNSKEYLNTNENTDISKNVIVNENILKKEFCKVILNTMKRIENETLNK